MADFQKGDTVRIINESLADEWLIGHMVGKVVVLAWPMRKNPEGEEYITLISGGYAPEGCLEHVDISSESTSKG